MTEKRDGLLPRPSDDIHRIAEEFLREYLTKNPSKHESVRLSITRTTSLVSGYKSKRISWLESSSNSD
jgi:hypothetical protein